MSEIYDDDQFAQAEAAGFNPYAGSEPQAQAQPLPSEWTVPDIIPDWM